MNSQNNNIDTENEYLKLIKEIKDNKEGLDDAQEGIDKYVEKTNILFKKVKNSNELKLDAKIFCQTNKISNHLLKKAFKTQTINSKDLINFLFQENNTEQVNYFYKEIEKYYYGFRFYNPTIFYNSDRERKGNNKKEMEKKEENEKIIAGVKQEQTADRTDEIMRDLTIKINSVKKEDFYKFVLDKNSYARTIENLFYISLATKLKIISISIENNQLFVNKYLPENDELSEVKNHQFIFTITYGEYRQLLNKFNL